MNPILRLALPVPLHTVFDYRLPAGATASPGPGCRVLVPFGRRTLVGIVVDDASSSEVDEARLKSATRILDESPLLTAELMSTLRWAARYYQYPLGEVLQAALPAALRSARELPSTGVDVLRRVAAIGADTADAGPQRGTRAAALLDVLSAGPLPPAVARARSGASPAVIRAALAKGWIERARVPLCDLLPSPVAGPPLNDEQRVAASAVIDAEGFVPFLLDGVTGSGKTEVYLSIIRDCVARGRQALVLVPEIALTPQALRRFRERLGVEIAALHSGLGESERARAWLAAARGEAQVVLGTRSALFVPLRRPGVIVVDEEHDASYKQQEGFRYHARDLALIRAKTCGVPVVLGSATPSLESLANAEAGRYRLLRLTRRAGLATPPALRVVDVRRQVLKHGLAAATLEAIGDCLARGEQALIFKNRRGYAPVLMCHDCGWSAQCPQCERAMTLHRAARRLRCHHCGHEQPVPSACPACAGLALQPLGQGTERLEEALAAQFPEVPIARVDRDTTRGRRAREALLDRLPAEGARILIGTQMLAKGHDLPHLTLVVVVGVDEGLHSVDFRASERLGQLVVQVAGRAGRAERSGRMILQTHDPAHPLLATLLNGGYRALARPLLDDRRAASLPPFAHFALLRAESEDRSALGAFLGAAVATGGTQTAVTLHGPLDAPMPRRAGAYRGQILLEAAERAALQAFLPTWLEQVRSIPGERRLRWSIDVDPVDLY